MRGRRGFPEKRKISHKFQRNRTAAAPQNDRVKTGVACSLGIAVRARRAAVKASGRTVISR